MSESNPLISVIVVCTNEKRFVDPCLRSVLSDLSGINAEVILVDNNSSDGSREEVRSKFPEVRLIENPKNKGAAYARNMGIHASRGTYLAFLDCDTEVQPGALPGLLQYIQLHADIGILSPQLIYPDRSLQYSCRPFPSLLTFLLRIVWDGDLKFLQNRKSFLSLHKYFMTDWDHRSVREVDWTMSASWVMPRMLIDQIGLFDQRYFYNYEDVDLSWRAKRAGWKIVYYPNVCVMHHYQRLSSKGGIRNPLKWSHLKSALRFFRKKAFT